MMNIDDDMEMSSASSSNGYKLVPWLSWEEWDFVRESLFSSSSHKIASALQRISTWRSRGCLPVVIDVTSSIIEIQQKDPYYRGKEQQAADVLDSDQLLAMLYCMAIMRLVNCVVEKTRQKTAASIAEAANAIGIPRKLIDVRHEGSHRDLPALQVVRDCSDKALDWLQAYYWEPQKNQIPFQRDGNADIRREIRSNLHELAFCLKMKQSCQLGSSLMKGKRGKYCEGLCGRNKFISVISGKLHSPKPGGFKKKLTKCLKNLVKLYSTFSSEIVSVLLEFLLNAFESSNMEFPNDSHVVKNMHMSLEDWKPVITRFSNKEPELLLSLLKAVLHIIANEAAMDYETGGQSLTSSEYTMGTRQIENLSYLFTWLVGLLGGLKPLCRTDSSAGENTPHSVVLELLRKCLLVSASGNKLLMDSSLHLAQMVGNLSIVDKLKKLSWICYVIDENSSLTSSKNLLIQQEDSILQEAAKKLAFVKHHRMKRKVVMAADGDVRKRNRWVVAKSWNSCPIGLLPCDLGSSGRLLILDCDDRKQSGTEQSEKNEIVELKRCSSKREASCDIQRFDNPSIKKMKGTVEVCQSKNDEVSLFEGAKGHLMIGGVWKRVGEEELQTIKCGVKILTLIT